MEAKDTELTQKQIDKIDEQGVIDGDIVPYLKAQAEISFKLGEQEGWKKREELAIESIKTAYQNGIREVVEWIEKESVHKDGLSHYCPNCDHTIIGVNPYEWEAQKKEWGGMI